MLFTPWNKQYNYRPEISLEGIEVALNKYLKFLGVTFDPMYTFYHHILDIYAKACQRLNILRAVSSSSWGHDKETLIITYRALIVSVLTYACAVWFPNAKPTNIQKLQFVQNSALCLIPYCHKATDIDHLHAETKFMPVATHLSMLCTQFLASCLRTSHPSHNVVKLPPGPRHNVYGRPLKETLSSKFQDAVSPFLTNGIMQECDYKNPKMLSTLQQSVPPLPLPNQIGCSAPALLRFIHRNVTCLGFIKQTCPIFVQTGVRV
jgi:hypothetical protein